MKSLVPSPFGEGVSKLWSSFEVVVAGCFVFLEEGGRVFPRKDDTKRENSIMGIIYDTGTWHLSISSPLLA